MKKFYFIFGFALLVSCSSDEANTPEVADLIIGTWTELGGGDVLDDGTDQFTEFDYFCVTLGRFAFESDGTFRVETFDGPDDTCFSTGVLTGAWENQGDTYLLRVLTDTSDESEAGQEANIRIEFPTNDTMQWIFEVDAFGVDYEYELYGRVN